MLFSPVVTASSIDKTHGCTNYHTDRYPPKTAWMENTMKRPVLIAASLLIACSALLTWPAASAAPDEIIAARRANQKRVSDLTKVIGGAVKQNAAAATMVEQVKEITERTKLIKGYFPDGTQTGDTKAKAEIWTDRAGFNAAADSYIAEFDKLLVLAQAGDTAGFAPQFETATATCGACHRKYRER
jgi:cytochrome c556